MTAVQNFDGSSAPKINFGRFQEFNMTDLLQTNNFLSFYRPIIRETFWTLLPIAIKTTYADGPLCGFTALLHIHVEVATTLYYYTIYLLYYLYYYLSDYTVWKYEGYFVLRFTIGYFDWRINWIWKI